MPMRGLVHVALVLTLSAVCWAQTESQQPPPRSVSPQPATDSLPVRRVVLYKTGVGYFEHVGRVRGSQEVAVRFTSSQLNDVLKSLTAIDLGSGRIAGISYNSVAPLSHRLAALRLPLDQHATLTDLLGTLRGAPIEVSSATAASTGRLLGVERHVRTVGTQAIDVDYLSMITPSGEIRTFELSPGLRVRLLDVDLRREVGQYLDLVGSAREQDARRMVIQTVGDGERDLLVSYVSEVPVWKSTYRLVLPKDGKPLIQGWAIVDNTIGEDWNRVSLSLVAGAPQSFVQQISQPLYTQRPVVPMPRNVLLAPQTHQATLTSGSGVVRGVVRDASGQPLPGVRVTVRDGTREFSGVTNPRGEYMVEAPAAAYRIEFRLPGFQTMAYDGVALGGGVERQQDVRMQTGGAQETAIVEPQLQRPLESGRVGGRGTADAISRQRLVEGGVPGGVVGGVVGGLPSASSPPPAPVLEFAAQAIDLGDLFEYRITEPVSLARNQSALVPIVSAGVEVEKVSLWSGRLRSGRPLRALWLTNTSGLTLDGGSFSVVDEGAFAGEGLMEPLEPGERRLLSYAADLAVLVSAREDAPRGRLVRVRARDGIITQQSEERASWTYTLRNEDAAPRVVVIEHPIRSGWKLAQGITPAESSPTAHRFRVPVESRKEMSLDVSEVRLGESKVSLTDLSDDQIVAWRQAGIDAAALEQALRPILEKKGDVSRRERRLEQLDGGRQAIAADQQRVRENMKALRGSAEERQLLRRYTAQLNEQEDRLAAVEREIAAEKAGLDKARAELSTLIGALSFEFTAPAAEAGRPDATNISRGADRGGYRREPRPADRS
jgi:hypothetical protein